MTYRLGYLPDPADPRDRLLGARLAPPKKLPKKYGRMAETYELQLEQHAQSCVGFAVAMALYASWNVQGVPDPIVPSARFVWYNARATHGATALDSPTYIRQALRQLNKIGYCAESVCRSLAGADKREAGQRPSLLAYNRAHDQQLDAAEYLRIEGGDLVGQWKLALSQNRPIVFGIPVTEAYGRLGAHDVYRGDPGPVLGGHAQCALGYDDLGPYGPGSWGKNWGNAGWWHCSWDFIAEHAKDQWAFVAPPYFRGVTSAG